MFFRVSQAFFTLGADFENVSRFYPLRLVSLVILILICLLHTES